MSALAICSPRILSLICLVIQNAGLVMLMRYSRSRRDRQMFLASTAVCLDEFSKFCVSFIMVYVNHRKLHAQPQKDELMEDSEDGKSFLSYMRNQVVTTTALLMAVPALLYTVQKNLLYVALSNLDACVYQVSYSAKLLTTAVFSFLILGRKFSFWQQVGLVTLMAGVCLVQISQIHETVKPTGERPMLGFIAVSLACCTSGFASVYFEYWLKKSQDFWVKQAQLAFFAMILAFFAVITQDLKELREGGFFQGYDIIVALTIFFEAGGGIIVAVVTKYADSIAKNFATALSLTLTTALSTIFWEFQLSSSFVAGAVLTLGATYLYQSSLPPLSRGQMAKAGLAVAAVVLLSILLSSGGGVPASGDLVPQRVGLGARASALGEEAGDEAGPGLLDDAAPPEDPS